MTDRLHASTLARLQLEDARRACLTAACSLHLVAGDATDTALLAAVQRIHAAICAHVDELADLSLRARTPT